MQVANNRLAWGTRGWPQPYFVVVQLLSHVLFATSSTPGFCVLHCLLEFAQVMSIEMVMLSNHLMLDANSTGQSVPQSSLGQS